ncbi:MULTISPECIES: ATP-dependent helicase HrpB [Rhodanobacter]|uniref:ATP-dependent helicase HrpB n=1 Tax=Rhodanobacter TaxID=75309 RepID=UPI0004052397|nr:MULTISPECIES: ATP-dependent helicase HrpB [Rhodanobacter]KZC19593.1 ATP-dependent helicase HrpB [Rhodanobacter denitrificans]UJJ50855.1 ATP-dependent helicase HrpB [Rhodanobacter denitrificans]UJM93570.1 ATP-dependent helicase HrpB [Rhodanobacter denitrificans]UJM97101.1 ATP-dependent helicase HrpB [Rhodanobacter denitrificans]UJN20071.1 ATP-dependent helicase HrpB [Rhodanobacter denitrificans]
MSALPSFPITPLLPEIRASLAATPRLVLEAPPGAGKTTQVPLALLDASWLAGQKIVMLEPRRIAARAAAQFMAQQLGEDVGQTVGYRIRFESKVSAATRIEVVTEGILARLIQHDPELGGIGAIVFDEFHERHLAGDLGAALALEVQATLRPQLRLLVMSATLDGERIAAWLDAPRLTSPGRSYPVRIEYPPARAQETLEQQLARVAKQALEQNDGDVLAFLPGRREIARAQAVLAQVLARDDVELVALHGELSLAEQQAALAPAEPGTRRIVLATNVAESSVTAPGIRAVVDSGLAREPRFDPNSGFTRLQTVNIAQASADQRAGRAGRVAAGTTYRLWPQSRRLDPARSAEIAQAELSGLALELAAWGSDTLPWLDPPPPGALAQARELLKSLAALDADGRITALGRRMLELGATPRLGAAALRAPPELHALVADLLALMEARSPLRGMQARSDDFRARVAALHAWRDRRGAAARGEVDSAALAAIEQASKGWRRRLDVRSAASGVPDSHAVGDLLLHAFPDRIARRDERNPLRYTLANGRGARLHEHTALLGEPWLLVLDLRLEARDSLVFAAAPFDPCVLERDYPAQFCRERTLRWNDERGAAEAFDERRFGAIVLERRSVPVKPADALPALLAAVRAKGLDALPWSEHARRLLARMQALRGWMPELGLPDVSEPALLASLEDWLAPHLEGSHRLDALSTEQLAQALASRFDHAQRRTLDAQAPESLVVPSGQNRRLEYAEGAPPVLAVKLQELFGLADTPRIGGGRIPVTLHLLSPAGRPIQVTQDLKGFWERTYPEVKKELKGRYPRHPWPDDPWTATPTHRAKPRERN